VVLKARQAKNRPKRRQNPRNSPVSVETVRYLNTAKATDKLIAEAYDSDVRRIGTQITQRNTTPTGVMFTRTNRTVAHILRREGMDTAAAQTFADMISQVLESTANASMRTAYNIASNMAYDPARTARVIRDSVGMDPRSVTALENYERTLGSTKTPVSPGRAKIMVNQYATRLKAARTATVARTQTTLALNQARYQEWQRRATAGFQDPASMVEWITTPDDKLCDPCAALSGLRVPFNQQFASSVGNVLHPPLHPNCRCTVILVLP
jgi:SPP1 gp7 family putative phage head morphogenesis protein